jgi:CHAD domain-containing protein
MPKTVAVDGIFEGHVREFVSMIPAVRDGGSEAIHDARIATRRIRAALQIVSERYEKGAIKAIKRTVGRAGRALGRARDLDVLLGLVAELERKTSAAGTAALPLRHRLLDEQKDRRRMLLTRIDEMPLRSLSDTVIQARLKDTRFHLSHVVSRPACAASFREQLAARMGRVRHAVEEASGIYVPEKAHAARIAIKKLRYLLEIVEAARLWNPADAVKTVKRAQGELGEAHDRHLLIDRLNEIDGEEFLRERSLAKQLLDAECQDHYSKYVAHRGNLLTVCHSIETFLHPHSFLKQHGSVLAALMVPAALVAAHVSGGYLANRSIRHILLRE